MCQLFNSESSIGVTEAKFAKEIMKILHLNINIVYLFLKYKII